MLITNTTHQLVARAMIVMKVACCHSKLTERIVGVPTEHAGSLDKLYRRLYEDFNVLVDRSEFQRQLVVLIMGAGNMQTHRLAEIVNGHSGNISLHL